MLFEEVIAKMKTAIFCPTVYILCFSAIAMGFDLIQIKNRPNNDQIKTFACLEGIVAETRHRDLETENALVTRHRSVDRSQVYTRQESMSPLCWQHDTTSAVDSSSYPRRPRLSGGCSACMEQSATRDSGLLLTFDSPEGDQVSPFSSVIRLTWRRLLRWSADVCIELCNCNGFKSRFL